MTLTLAYFLFFAPLLLAAVAAARQILKIWANRRRTQAQRGLNVPLAPSEPVAIFRHRGSVHDFWLFPAICSAPFLAWAYLFNSWRVVALCAVLVGYYGFKRWRKDRPYFAATGRKPVLDLQPESLRYLDEFCVEWGAVVDARVEAVSYGQYRSYWLVLAVKEPHRWLQEKWEGGITAYHKHYRYFQKSPATSLVVALQDLEDWADEGTVLELIRKRIGAGFAKNQF